MKSFGELLTEYMLRTGISDSEMARHLGVSRQTIFRWKEGMTARPRDRRDVIKCAERLRLAPAERDSLLLAAGFAPETVRPTDVNHALTTAQPGLSTTVGPAEIQVPAANDPLASNGGTHRRERWLPALLIGLVLVVMLVGLTIFLPNERQALIALVVPPTPTALPTATPLPPDQLVAIAPLNSRGGTAPPYDVTARLRQALETEIQTRALSGAHIAELADQVRDAERAEQLRVRSGAQVMLWGNFAGDSARVEIGYAPRIPALHHNASLQPLLPRDLSVTLDMRVPEQVRALAQLILVPLRLDREGASQAQTLLDTANEFTPGTVEMRTAFDFYRGYLAQTTAPRDLEAAVSAYTRSLYTSSLYETYLNRGLAYLALNQDEAAQADFLSARQIAGERPEAWRATCWGFALVQQPQTALPFCQAAAVRDVTAWSLDTRGIVYAELGRYAEAATEFENLLRWLDMQPTATREAFAPMRLAWIETLRAGKNPFDPETLSQMRGAP